MSKIPDQVKIARRIARRERLQQEKDFGRCRTSSWGGKDSTKADRRKAKKDLRNW